MAQDEFGNAANDPSPQAVFMPLEEALSGSLDEAGLTEPVIREAKAVMQGADLHTAEAVAALLRYSIALHAKQIHDLNEVESKDEMEDLVGSASIIGGILSGVEVQIEALKKNGERPDTPQPL